MSYHYKDPIKSVGLDIIIHFIECHDISEKIAYFDVIKHSLKMSLVRRTVYELCNFIPIKWRRIHTSHNTIQIKIKKRISK
jgi:hypothetical protein